MDGVSVTGHGVVSAAPDKAVVSLGVSVLGDSANAARDEAARGANALIEALGKHAIAEADRQTSGFRVAPEYDYADGAQRLRGYRVTNTLTVTVRALDGLAALIDDVTRSVEALVLHGLEFDVEDRRQIQRTALEHAVADARARAETLAGATGVRLGAVTSLDAREASRGPTPVPRMALMAAERGGATPIETGRVEVEATVDITYAIAG
jgi:uncharacterized protein YggE